MRCKQLAVWILLIVGTVISMHSQNTTDDNLPVDRMDNIRLVFTRGFILSGVDGDDQAPVNGSLSGSLFIGVGFKMNLSNNTIGLRIAPGVNWYKLNYQQEGQKTFPTDTTFETEKHRFTYLELPIGLYLNFSKDEDGDPKLFAEAGGFLGYKIEGIYKRKFDFNGRTSKLKRTDVPMLEDWRYGIYSRLGYKRWAIYYSFLLSDVFKGFLTEDGTAEQSDITLPPPMEVGISFFL